MRRSSEYRADFQEVIKLRLFVPTSLHLRAQKRQGTVPIMIPIAIHIPSPSITHFTKRCQRFGHIWPFAIFDHCFSSTWPSSTNLPTFNIHRQINMLDKIEFTYPVWHEAWIYNNATFDFFRRQTGRRNFWIWEYTVTITFAIYSHHFRKVSKLNNTEWTRRWGHVYRFLLLKRSISWQCSAALS